MNNKKKNKGYQRISKHLKKNVVQNKKKKKKTKKINGIINQKGGDVYFQPDITGRFLIEKNNEDDIIIIDTQTLNYRKFDKYELSNINLFWVYILEEETIYKVENYHYDSSIKINYDKQINLEDKYKETENVSNIFLNIKKIKEDGIFFFMMFNDKLALNNLNIYIESLNKEISKKCKTLKIKFGPYKDMSGEITQYSEYDDKYILLCLYYNDNCISSIALIYGHFGWEILSRTHQNYMSRKYNKLLRAIMILLCSKMFFDSYSIDTIVSIPSNPISLWTLKKEYKITYQPETDKIKDLIDTNNKKEFMDKQLIEDILVFININDNLKKAHKVFDTLISNLSNNIPASIICPDVSI